MQETLKKGRVVRVTGQELWVDIDGRRVICVMRGRLRVKEVRRVVAGDIVQVSIPANDTMATIEGVEPRQSWLSRYVERESRERVIVANIDVLFVVAAAASPDLHPSFVDRVLVSAEWGQVRAVVVVNKMDLADRTEVDAFTALYASCGYPVVLTSAQDGIGVEDLVSHIPDGVVAFVGESGVGKSTLLMRIDPNLDLKVREIGERTGRGRHTTSNSQLFSFGGGFLADTPGVQTFGFPGTDEIALGDCFPEFAAHVDACRFNPCSHSHEPNCGIKDAIDAGLIGASRHESYLSILSEIQARESRRER